MISFANKNKLLKNLTKVSCKIIENEMLNDCLIR